MISCEFIPYKTITLIISLKNMDSLHDRSGLISKLALFWVLPLLKRFHKVSPNDENLEPIPVEDDLN